MNNKKTFLILLLVFILVLALSGALYSRLGSGGNAQQLATTPTQDATTPTPQAAPDITVYDLQGNPVQLSSYKGKPVVLNFWASWCGPCQMEMPDFQEKYLALGDDVQFLMVNMTDGSRETVEDASGFIARYGYTFPVFYDTDQDAAVTYAVYSLPTTYFIDAQGRLVAQGSGALDGATLQRGIDMIR